MHNLEMPNFIEIGQAVTKISRFSICYDGRRPSWIFKFLKS